MTDNNFTSCLLMSQLLYAFFLIVQNIVHDLVLEIWIAQGTGNFDINSTSLGWISPLSVTSKDSLASTVLEKQKDSIRSIRNRYVSISQKHSH